MYSKVILGMLLCVLHVHASNCSYLYPIANTLSEDAQGVFVLHQLCNGQVSLYAWNSNTQQTQKLLWSAYVPHEVQLLPSRTGFGFVHDDKICIKFFEQRSVRAFDFSEASCTFNAIGCLCWLTDHLCLFHAKSEGYYNIYVCTDDGQVRPILVEKYADSMFPCHIGSMLFFACVYRHGQSAVYSAMYDSTQITKKVFNQSKCLCVDGAIVALYMRSLQDGFITVRRNGTQPGNDYFFYRLFQSEEHWRCHLLFTFKLPYDLLYGCNRLRCELAPLLPYVVGDFVYFVSLVDGKSVLYKFSLHNGTIYPLACTTTDNRRLFAPVMTKNGLFCGWQTFQTNNDSSNDEIRLIAVG